MGYQSDDAYRRQFSRFLRALLAGGAPADSPLNFGTHTETAEALVGAWRTGGADAVRRVFDALSAGSPELQVLASASLEAVAGKKSDGMPNLGKFQALPDSALLSDALLRAGCPYLANYIAFSRRWSPRGYEGYHPACGIWLLATVAAGRVTCHLGGLRKTGFSIALTGRSSLWAKTTTAKIAGQVLADADLDWLLFQSDEASPQKFLQSMVGRLPDNYSSLPADRQAREVRSYALSGQRGWYYDEFGQLIAQMSKQNGYMADFRGILRWIDDNKRSHTVGTLSRGNEEILNPYLSLLANMTPADLKTAGKRGAGMWNDGNFGRIAFVCPPPQMPTSNARFPMGRRETPEWLITPLQEWHARLGEPEVMVTPLTDKKGDETGQVEVERLTPLPEQELAIKPAVFEAFYTYGDALTEQIRSFDNDDLNSNYARFAEKALRLAMLFASVGGSDEIRMEHWTLAQAICEEWRACLHSLIEQINEPEPGFEELVESKILGFIERWRLQNRMPTRREIRQYVTGCSTEQLTRMVRAMVDTGTLDEIRLGKTTYYRFPTIEEDAEQLDVSEPVMV